ncbi:DUF3592 domain-containing protein [Larkinella soli]|uniref:DUF3592 domain-containing protein n=1 Tax=Larkinella soli TaxID=1770527 RepID=UPI000FFCC4F2|nr:DUF3592 domain-containing protein [Larkinella soli]
MTILTFCLTLDALLLLAGVYGFSTGSLSSTPPTILSAVFGFIGLNMLTGSLYSYHKTRTWLADTVRTSGEVIAHEGRESTDSFNRETKREYTVYYPVVRYRTQTGQTVSFTSSVGSSTPDHQVGEEVGVRYVPNDPGSARVDEFFSLWLVPLVLTCLGAGMIIASLGLSCECLAP